MGEFEHMVLLAVLHQGDEAYGTTILRCLEERTGRGPSFGAIYSTLRRLEAKGWITSERRGSSADSSTRDRKYVRITEAGRRELAETQERLRKMSEGLDAAHVRPAPRG